MIFANCNITSSLCWVSFDVMVYMSELWHTRVEKIKSANSISMSKLKAA